MDTIRLKNGKQVTVNTKQHIYDEIESSLGYEFCQAAKEALDATSERQAYEAKLQLYKDNADDWERTSDGYHTLANDAMENLEEILKYMKESKRINKDNLYKMILHAYNDLYQNM